MVKYISPWTDKVVDHMLHLHSEGFSAYRIAVLLNEIYKTELTKNAILGKIWRMNNYAWAKEYARNYYK